MALKAVLTGGRRGRFWMVFLLAAVATLVSGVVVAFGGQALFSALTQAPTEQGVRCDIYPIAIPHSVVSSANPGTVINKMPRGSGPGISVG